MMMNKYFRLLTTLLLAISATALALPQPNVSPASAPAPADGVQKHATAMIEPRVFPPTPASKGLEARSGGAVGAAPPVHLFPRQVRNADYGSGAGPSNPPAAPPQPQSTAAASPQDPAQKQDVADNSEKRDFSPQSEHDVDYSDIPAL